MVTAVRSDLNRRSFLENARIDAGFQTVRGFLELPYLKERMVEKRGSGRVFPGKIHVGLVGMVSSYCSGTVIRQLRVHTIFVLQSGR